MDETRALKDKLDEPRQNRSPNFDEQMRRSLASIPNLTRDEVPTGKSEADNVTVKTWGEKPTFDFTPSPTGNSAKPSASSTWNAPPSSPARALPSTWAPARAWSAR